jgi:hypothetical protein
MSGVRWLRPCVLSTDCVTLLTQPHNNPPCYVQALCLACGSDPDKGTAKKMGAYVMKTCFQTTTVSRWEGNIDVLAFICVSCPCPLPHAPHCHDMP